MSLNWLTIISCPSCLMICNTTLHKSFGIVGISNQAIISSRFANAMIEAEFKCWHVGLLLVRVIIECFVKKSQFALSTTIKSNGWQQGYVKKWPFDKRELTSWPASHKLQLLPRLLLFLPKCYNNMWALCYCLHQEYFLKWAHGSFYNNQNIPVHSSYFS